MKTAAAAALLHLCLCATAAVSSDDSTETVLTAALGDVAVFPCYSVGSDPPTQTVWMKNGQEVIRGGPGGSSAGTDGRLSVLPSGSLSISALVPGDEGSYLCNSSLQGGYTYRARVLLRVSSGPENVSMTISPTTALSNGTLTAIRGQSVSFNCSASSYPSQHLTWAFNGSSSSNESLASASAPWLDFRIEEVQPSAQGVYTCTAHNPLSLQAVTKSTELLVYYVPDRHPECMWDPPSDSTQVHFSCSWFGAYPSPTLRLGSDQGQTRDQGPVYMSGEADNLTVTLNHTVLFDGQTLRCTAQHQALSAEEEKTCSLTLKFPFPEGEPLAAAQEATSVTLTCTESVSVPPANTTWRRGLLQELIVPGSKYVLSEEGPTLRLTILNITKDDEGVYFCHSENALAVRELEVYLTVRTSSAYTGAIIGIFIAALIVGSGVIVAKTVYSSRHRICLGGGFGQLEEDRGDVLSLVESDDEQIFQDTVPQLPPITNGRQTTLVQIHRIPSSDHEDADIPETSPEQQEDTVQTEIEEQGVLVTF